MNERRIDRRQRHFGVECIPHKGVKLEPYARSSDHTVVSFLLDEARNHAREDSRRQQIKRAYVIDWQRVAIRRRIETWEDGEKIDSLIDQIKALIDRINPW